MVTILARATNLGAQSYYYCRMFHDTSVHSINETFISREVAKKDFAHRAGFVRVGSYGVEIPSSTRDSVILEFGLNGQGRLELADAQCINVFALEAAYKGKKLVSRREYYSYPVSERELFVCFPEHIISKEGLRFILEGYIPVKYWLWPIIFWGSFLILVLLSYFVIGVIMRRQWVQNERYPLPVAQIPIMLLGEGNQPGDVPAVWRNGIMWIGFAIALFWGLMKVWKTFNPNVPDLQIYIAIKSYLPDAFWGRSWNDMYFSVYAVFLSLALFMELNVLLSLSLGFLLFRLQYWFGEANGLAANTLYPFPAEQQAGAYVAYTLMVLFLYPQISVESARGGYCTRGKNR